MKASGREGDKSPPEVTLGPPLARSKARAAADFIFGVWHAAAARGLAHKAEEKRAAGVACSLSSVEHRHIGRTHS